VLKQKAEETALKLDTEFTPLNGLTKKLNSVAFSPQANYTDRPPLVGEVSANFCG
jgi:hypothetical protein